MRPPFPGMDPWLEDPGLWPDVHNSLAIAIRDVLTPLVVPRDFVRVVSRMTVLAGEDLDRLYRPGEAIRAGNPAAAESEANLAVMDLVETRPTRAVVGVTKDDIEECFLTIRELPGRKSATAIEVLSPTNKSTKVIRREYPGRRRDLGRSGLNLVEIDLLRAGQRMPSRHAPLRTDYCILADRARPNNLSEVYEFSYRDRIPSITIPLRFGESEPVLDLNSILHAFYERAGYDLAIDDRRPPDHPPLRKKDPDWAAAIIARASVETPQVPAEGETTP